MPLRVATILAAAVGQHAQKLDIVLFEERQHPVVEQFRRGDGRLAIVELGASDLGIGIDEGLLVDPADALQIADIERILGVSQRCRTSTVCLLPRRCRSRAWIRSS